MLATAAAQGPEPVGLHNAAIRTVPSILIPGVEARSGLDSVRATGSHTQWATGAIVGASIGLLAGVAFSFSPHEGEPNTLGEKVGTSLVMGGLIGVPLAVIGAFIGGASHR
jgi:hypothetical protein